MVTHIQFHRSDDAGVTPDVETMFTGEPAVNLADKKFWVKGASGELITLIDGPTGPFGALVVDGIISAADVESKLGFSAGANIALGLSNVGNEKRITISSSDRASTIAGSDGEVQFNASDGFSADSGLVYNETANRLGVAVAGGSERVRSTIEAAGVVMAGGFSGATGIFATGITADTIWHEGGLGAALKINVGSTTPLELAPGLVTINPQNGDINFRVDGDTDNLIYADASADKVGIKTSTPTETLDVRGGITASGIIYSAAGLSSGGPIYASNVGDVVLTLNADRDDSGENDNPLISMGQDGVGGRFQIGLVGDGGQIFTNSRSNAAFLNTGSSYNDLQFAVNDKMIMTILDTDKVGIKTSTPREALEVVGNVMTNAGFSGATGIFATGITLGQGSNYGNIWMPTNGNLRFIIGSENILDIDTGALFHINSSNSRTGFRVDSNKNDHAIFTHPTEGKVGILVGDPQESLHVIGSVQASAGVSGATGVFGTNVGIATKTPRESLEVRGNIMTNAGVSGATFEVGNNIKFSDGSTLGTAQKSNIGVFLQTGGPETITTGNKGHRIIPYDCEVTQWTLTAPTSGSVTFDINWCTYANWPNAASVGFASGAVQPALRSATKNQQSLSSGNWTKGTFSEGEIIEFEVDGVSGVTACNLTLHIRSK